GTQKLVNPDFLLSLTEAQLRLFIDVSIWADGHSELKPSGLYRRRISQGDKERLDLFQMACCLAGINSVMTYREVRGFDRWQLSLLEGRPYVAPRHAEQHPRHGGPGVFAISEE